MKEYKKFISIFIIIFISGISISKEQTKIQDVHKALQEVAYSYYMRGKDIQYNSHKVHYFSPEEATSQNVNYMVCSGFTRNVYRELLNITIPMYTATLLSYSKENVGNPEVVLYSHINENKQVEMKIYSSKESNNYTTLINPSLKDIIPLVQVGDVLTYTGHTFLIYDVEKDSTGKITDAIIMESGHGRGRAYVNSKIAKKVKLSNGADFAGANHFLYLNAQLNPNFKEGRIQGSVGLSRLSTYKSWVNINNTKLRKNEYSILRFIQKDSDGNAILKYKTKYTNYPNQILNDQLIVLPKKSIDRYKKFNHLYIEKTVSANNNNIVELNDILNYKIVIKNFGSKIYSYNLIVYENLPKYVTFIDHQENDTILSFNQEPENKRLKWDLGKLKKGQEFIINYTVKVTSGKPGDIIESTGLVGNIPSSIIRNTIGVNLDANKMNLIKTKFEKLRLKKKYNGKKLINEAYKEALNYDMRLDEFDITKLIFNTKLDSTSYKTIFLNQQNPFYKAVLNKCWSTLTSVNHTYIKGGEQVAIYDLKGFRNYQDPERRRHHINPKTFKTGDILIYKNHNDAVYSVDKDNKLNKTYITYENGEYAYIYIEGKGFVGYNIGDDGKENTKDDRNEFNAKYYTDNNLELYPKSKNPTEEELENANIQSLFSKDYYVILRPSLAFSFGTNNAKKNELLINSIKNKIKFK